MRFARLVFGLAGIYGLLAIVPCYFLKGYIDKEAPPAITHPEFYYGFLGVALAWQLAFLVMAADPRRYTAFIPVACVEKFSFAIACAVLFVQGRLSSMFYVQPCIDAVLGVLFVMSYLRMRR